MDDCAMPLSTVVHDARLRNVDAREQLERMKDLFVAFVFSAFACMFAIGI
jgi:hypothetical protein